MKIGIMHPYLFPYLGYFQLLNEVDKYVIFDEAQYIKQGWINRNRLLGDTKGLNIPYFNFSIQKSPMTDPIVTKQYSSLELNKKTLLDRIQHVYKKATFYEDTVRLIKDILSYDDLNVAKFNSHSIKKIAEYLNIKTKIIISSEIMEKDYRVDELKCQDMVLHACKYFNASEYVNAIGGTGLYDKKVFAKSGINLHFLKTDELEYKQFTDHFVPNLSIIDVLMFNSREDAQNMLKKFTLV